MLFEAGHCSVIVERHNGDVLKPGIGKDFVDIEWVVLLCRMAFGRWWHVCVEFRFQKLRRFLAKGCFYVEQKVIHDEFVCKAVKSKKREQLVSTFDKNSSTWFHKMPHVSQCCTFVGYVWKDTHRNQTIKFARISHG